MFCCIHAAAQFLLVALVCLVSRLSHNRIDVFPKNPFRKRKRLFFFLLHPPLPFGLLPLRPSPASPSLLSLSRACAGTA